MLPSLTIAVVLLSLTSFAASAQDKKKTTKPTVSAKDSTKLGTEGTVVKPSDEPSTMQAIRAAKARGAEPPSGKTLPNGLKSGAAVLDLAVVEIKQDWEDYNTRYRVQITIRNLGALPLSQQVEVAAAALEAPVSIPDPLNWFQTNPATHFTIGPLAAGTSATFHLPGKHLATETVDVLVLIDGDKKSSDANRNNNLAHKTLGPH